MTNINIKGSKLNKEEDTQIKKDLQKLEKFKVKDISLTFKPYPNDEISAKLKINFNNEIIICSASSEDKIEAVKTAIDLVVRKIRKVKTEYERGRQPVIIPNDKQERVKKHSGEDLELQTLTDEGAEMLILGEGLDIVAYREPKVDLIKVLVSTPHGLKLFNII